MGEQIAYKAGYKYQLHKTYSLRIGDDTFPSASIGDWILLTDGILTIRAGYAWDGPSGPTWDSKTFMRGSLVHDALYQLMRAEKLDTEEYRKFADDLLRTICREDGMGWFRAWYVWKSVRWFAGAAASKENRRPVVYAPKSSTRTGAA